MERGGRGLSAVLRTVLLLRRMTAQLKEVRKKVLWCSIMNSLTLVMIGSFRNIFHDIGGQAYAVDSKTVLIKGFTYDGEGPDTFFLAGTSGRPSSSKGDAVLPWPYAGKDYTYSDRDIPLIKRSFDGGEDIVLTLPQGKTVDQLK